MAKQIPPPVELPPVTMNNTKKELLDAYEAAKDELARTQERFLTAEEARQKAEKIAATTTAAAQAAGDPVRRLQELRGDLSRELSDIAQRYEAEVATFQRLQQAIADKQSELNALFGIEAAAGDLAALIAAQQARKTEFETGMAAQKTQFESEMNASRTAWAEEKARRTADLKEEDAELKKRRAREQEDYEYALNRERDQRRNALEDELKALDRELASRRETFETETSSRSKALEEREAAVATREAELTQLRTRVEAFQGELSAGVKGAVDQTSQRLAADFAKERELIQARFDGERNVLLGKIEALETLVASQREQLAALAEKQEKAYEKVQDIATRAVAAAKREVIAIPGSSGKSQSAQE